MFGLGKQVHGDPVRVGLAVTDHQYLRRAGNHVDTDHPEYFALRGGHKNIPRTHNLVDRGHGFGAIGQRSHGLGATDSKHAVYPGNGGRCQHHVIHHTIRGRHHHDNFRHTSDFGRNRIHQYRRRIGRLATRHVQTGAIQRRYLLAQHGSVFVLVLPGLLILAFVVVTDASRRFFQTLTLILGNSVQSCLQTAFIHFQLSHGANVQAIKLGRKLQHRRIAPGLHLVQDMPNRLIHLMIHTVVPGQQLGQRTVKVALGGVQSGDSVGHFSDPVLE